MQTRKQFLASLAGLAGFAFIGACASDGSGEPSPDAGGNNGSGSGSNPGSTPDAGMSTPDSPTTTECIQGSTAISSNHGHTMTVSEADVTAGASKTYNIQGSSAHAHSVTLTAAHFTMLKANRSVTVVSTSGGAHTHNVTVTC